MRNPPTPSEQPPMAVRLHALIDFFEQLDRPALARLAAFYEPQARFKDPFNEVQGTAAIRRIFEHMFETLEAPRFVILTRVQQGDDAFLTWDFHFCLRGRALTLHGASHLHFGPDGRVRLHRDYWDAAEELYSKLPLLGILMRWLQRRLRVG